MKDQTQGAPTHIMVQDSLPAAQPMSDDTPGEPSDENSIFSSSAKAEPMLNHETEPQLTPASDAPEPSFQTEQNDSVFPTNEPDLAPPEPEAAPEEPAAPAEEPAHVEGLHVGPAKRRRPMKLILLVLLVLLAGAYLLVDSGAVKTSIDLPFHIFKQKTLAPAAQTSNTSNSNQSQANTVAVPSGFTEYKLAGTTITFAAPIAWGTPTSSNDPGYSARGGTNKSDGTYAYLVDFATNKDVELVVTSSKYLPAKRDTLYYDFLQWCTGTNDGKIYESTLHFSTSADKIDTPTTTTCDQGPVAATKLDTATIVQPKVKSTDGKTIGDIYTRNLQSTDLPVLRVKDATSANADQIKQLLQTVKVNAQS
jgi:hypothetical protein